MGLNYSENIVKKDLEKKGYDVIITNQDGMPDFRVFNFNTKDSGYIEVKQEPVVFTDLQKVKFQKLKDKIYIALVKSGEIIYYNYLTKEEIWRSTYFRKIKPISNIVCKKCKYSWFTTSKNWYVSCPRCLTKVKIQEVDNETKNRQN
jgi:hypothetical protein